MRNKFLMWWQAIFSYPQKNLSTEPVSYDAYWEARGRTMPQLSDWQKERADWALPYIQKIPNAQVVDVGSGDGAVLAYLKTQHPNMTGVGVDLAEGALLHVREQGFEAVCADIMKPETVNIPACDFVILFEIIEHVTESEQLVARALASARKGVCISVPNSGFFTHRLRLLFGKFPAQWIQHPSEHVRFWTLGDIHWWLKALGWEGRAKVTTYQGVPILKNLIPSWFAAGIVIFIAR